MKIYVGNLSLEMTEDGLRQAFEAFGQVRSVNIVRDRSTGESRGYGFVGMPSMKEAQLAIEKMDGKDLKGQTINVQKGRTKTNLHIRRSRRGNSRGNSYTSRDKRSSFDSRSRRGRRY